MPQTPPVQVGEPPTGAAQGVQELPQLLTLLLGTQLPPHG
jgi:hypothetical protein